MTEGAEGLTWTLIAWLLVMLTIPGVALFYGGMVRRKNAISTMGLPFVALIVVSLGGLLAALGGSFGSWKPLASPEGRAGILQAFGGALALSLVAGSLVERLRFWFFLLFGFLWSSVVYSSLVSWVWRDGWLARLGALDYAGGAVIHIAAGVTALVAALAVGPRAGFGRVEMRPNHLPLALCGAGLLWVGWCGFAAGHGASSLRTATGALVAIHVAAAASGLSWTAVEWLQRDKPTALGTVSGIVAGLVAIAPAAGYVTAPAAIVIGAGAGGLCYMVVNFVKPILGYDDSLDVFGMHAVGGAWGMLAVGLFATTTVNPDGSDGLFYGYPYLFMAQVAAVVTACLVSGALSWALIWIMRKVMPARVEAEAEVIGLDLAQHGERAYS